MNTLSKKYGVYCLILLCCQDERTLYILQNQGQRVGAIKFIIKIKITLYFAFLLFRYVSKT